MNFDTLKTTFGDIASDIKHYAHRGYQFTLVFTDEKDFRDALDAAEKARMVNHIDMFWSPVYADLEYPGYIAFKDKAYALHVHKEAGGCLISPHPMETSLPSDQTPSSEYPSYVLRG